jgi:hypothetical protein
MQAAIIPFLVGWISLLALGPSHGQGYGAAADSAFLSQTQLVALSFDGQNSGIVRQAAAQGFELSNGTPAQVAQWYTPYFPNLTAVFATDIRQGLALIWGASLGERGAKYSLGPSGVVGIALQQPMGPRSGVRLQLYGQFGGALNESHCLGDYGELGGMQHVNCRMAASILPPAQTLAYLWNLPPSLQATLKLTYEMRF